MCPGWNFGRDSPRFRFFGEKGLRCRNRKSLYSRPCGMRRYLSLAMIPIRCVLQGEENMADMTLLAFAVAAIIGIATPGPTLYWRLPMAGDSEYAAP